MEIFNRQTLFALFCFTPRFAMKKVWRNLQTMRWKILIFNAITYLTIKFYDFDKSYLARRVTFADDAGFLCFIA